MQIDTEQNIPDEFGVSKSGRQTAGIASRILEQKRIGFHVPTPRLRTALLIEFARRGYAIYANAFDIIRMSDPEKPIDEIDPARDFDELIIYEIKSTNRVLNSEWSRYFFSLSTAELLIAQSLQHRFRFAFVNITTKEHLELGLTDVFARAAAIYPSWSIRFK
jgi:hypothetical protein